LDKKIEAVDIKVEALKAEITSAAKISVLEDSVKQYWRGMFGRVESL